jgi:hypothetical protein
MGMSKELAGMKQIKDSNMTLRRVRRLASSYSTSRTEVVLDQIQFCEASRLYGCKNL